MEQLEFHPVNESRLRHPWRWIAGSLLIGVVLAAASAIENWTGIIASTLGGFAPLVHALPFVAAVCFWLSSLSETALIRTFRMTERWMGAMDIVARVLLTVFSVFVGLCFVVAVDQMWETNWPVIAALGIYILVPTLGMLPLGNELRVGVVALRSRVWAVWVARWSRTLQLGVILGCVVAVVWKPGWMGGAVLTLAVTLTAALVGYHRRQLFPRDSAVDDFVRLLESVRSAALETHHDNRDEWVTGVFAAMRSLQVHLCVRPRSMAPVIRSRSLSALCRIADAKATGREYLGGTYLKGPQARAGEAVLWLAGEDVALGAVQVVDALIQQVAPGSSPTAHRSEADIRQILKDSALPVTGMMPVRARRSAASPRTPDRRR